MHYFFYLYIDNIRTLSANIQFICIYFFLLQRRVQIFFFIFTENVYIHLGFFYNAKHSKTTAKLSENSRNKRPISCRVNSVTVPYRRSI